MISIRTEALPIIVAATLASTSAAQPIQYVETRKSDQADTIHGVRIADPYRWLEDDNSAETREWVKAQNAVTSGFMEALPQRAPTRKLFTDLYNFEKFGIPFKEGGRYFYTRNDGLQQQSVLYTVKKLSDAPQVAIDPNTLSKDGTVALTGTAVSRDGRFLAYGVSRAGSDWEEWKVRDLASGKDLADRIKWVKFSTGEWTPDGKGFFYSRFDEPKAGEAHTGSNYFQKVYFHRIGTDQSRDLLVYENKGNKDWGFSATVTDDGRHLLISVSKGTARESGLMWLPLKNGGYAAGQPKVLTLDFDAEYVVVGADRNTLWLKTDLDAPRGKIVVVDLGRPERKNWKTVVGEQKDALTAAGAVGGHLIAQYLQDAAGQVRVHGTNGKLVREVALPGVGSVGGFAGRYKQHETFFSYTSLTTPREIHRYDVNTGKTTLFKRPNTAFNADEFETRREFVTGKDGTRFPIFIAHRKGLTLDAGNATLLYGYGGFNVAETPTYRVTAATWLRMGGVYVTASIRGGGEYGSAWHAAGTKLSKQNVFDDFIAAGEWLIANKYTSPRKLAINGGSNGGLLVGAVLNQRPDLFAAAAPQVGVMDMLRFHKYTIGWAWVSDYGSSENAEEFKALYAYSPLHNVKRSVAYPPTLVTTADHDDRVVPAHSFKYTAEMQAAAAEYTNATAKPTGPILVRIETQAGHGAGTPTSKFIDERSDMLAFIANALGLPVR